jgi:hypothetical protein
VTFGFRISLIIIALFITNTLVADNFEIFVVAEIAGKVVFYLWFI